MELINTPIKIDRIISKLINKYDEVYIATAWATLGSMSSEVLLKNQDKISKMVIGINGYNTSPDFINEFKNCKNIKYILGEKGIFHPKIYLFYNSKKEWECLIGSANFTKSGMLNNTEIMIHTFSDGDNTKTFIDNLFREINMYFSLAYRMTNEKYNVYLKDYNQHKTKQNIVEKANQETENKMKDISINELSWNDYYNKVNNCFDDSLKDRIDLLKYVNEFFLQYKSLNKMNELEIKKIAGIVSKQDEKDIDWMYFGHMVSPRFKNQIIESIEKFSKAIDLIPIEGNITKKVYMNIINYVQKELPTGYGCKVRTLSRLLAMKRPDIFYCITSNNEFPLYRDFGIKPLKSDEFERYWDEVIVNIHNTPWYKSNEPKTEKEKTVWKVRAAMLDIITY